MSPSKMHYSEVLRSTAELLENLGNDELAARFRAESDDLLAAVTRKEFREVQHRVALHLRGTTGSFKDVISLNTNGSLSEERIAEHAHYVNELRKFTRKVF